MRKVVVIGDLQDQ